MRPGVSGWLLVAFFFFGGAALAAWEETRWIGIGQIWMAVAVVLALVYLGVPGKLGEKLGRRANVSVGGGGSKAGDSIDAAAQLQRLERLRQNGNLTDDEYGAQRDRILSQL